MITDICPLCGKDSLCRPAAKGINGFKSYYCRTYQAEFLLGDEILNMDNDEETKEKLLDLVAEQLVQKPYCIVEGRKIEWAFLYKQDYVLPDNSPPFFINLADRITNYPNTVLEKVNRGLLNLSYYYPHYGDLIEIDRENQRLIFERNDNNSHGRYGLVDFYEELGYFKSVRMLSSKEYTMTALGWQKIEELKKDELTLKQGFIAMKFGDDTKFIREAFRKAIRESGYSERFIDEKEHNNQIVPEILFEIERSKFMVVDITFPNYGAYYEAGYGQALGKEVIICCRKEEFDSLEKKPHFDIAQKSMIVWTDTDDLVARLKRRIEATVTK